MNRSAFLLAAASMVTPLLTWAGEPFALFDELPFHDTAWDSVDLQLANPAGETFAPIALIEEAEPSFALVSYDEFPRALEGTLPVSDSDIELTTQPCSHCGQNCQHVVCVNGCHPNICRFDYPADECMCTTDRYCRYPWIENIGSCHQVDDSGKWLCDGCGVDVFCQPSWGPDVAVRFGWWAVATDGSLLKIGEYQDLAPSPFWDVDGIWTNGVQTLDMTLSGLDNEANSARAYYYAPGHAAKVEYERYLRRWDHDPLSGFDLNGPVAPGPNDKVVSEDLNVGEDYAIRVQQLDVRFQGRLTKNLKWKLNLWGMRKAGERQANATAHCFDLDPSPGDQNNTCHVLSQRQAIDWMTLEIQPVVEARFNNTVVEYSRTMRGFTQNDQPVDRTYTRFDFSPASGTGGPPFLYAFVPDNFTQIDRLKISAPLKGDNQFYANLYIGDTENDFRETHRGFSGYDLRLINTAFDRLTFTGYAKVDAQNNELPTNLLTSPPFAIGAGNPTRFEPGSLRHPVDYNASRFGLKGQWRADSAGLDYVAAGYEYYELARDFATYNTLSGPFTQPDTKSHQISIAPYTQLSPTLNTFVRYKGLFVEDPLIGVRENDGMFNTNQPQQVHLVEIGGTWTPTRNFLAMAQFGIENSWNHSSFADFDEDNYPISCTFWYAPSERLSLNGGYAYFSNWIDQDITIGFRTAPTETTPWDYAGQSSFISIGANYAWSSSLHFVGGVEWNRGTNVFTVPPSPAGADWSLLPSFSNVIVETIRINMGIDYQLGPTSECYFRYVNFDYDDKSMPFNSGTAHMFLAGVSMIH